MTATATKRVIVCGSRDFQDRQLVETTIEKLIGACKKSDRKLVIVHGACPTGADHFAHEVATRAFHRGENVIIEPHPANWAEGKGAGPARNRRMARLGAELCLAFWDGSSRGTLDMMQQALICQIPVLVPTTARILLVNTFLQAFGVQT